MATSVVQEIVNSVQLTSSSATLYTAPAGTWVQILRLVATNVDTASHQITFQLVPSGGSAGTVNKTTDALVVLPHSNYPGYNEYGLVLNPGDKLAGFAESGSVVNVFASGLLTFS